jgi:hypothetical protein
MDRRLFVLAKVVVGVLGIPTILGVVWFADSLSSVEIITGSILGLSSLLAAAIPKRMFSRSPMRAFTLLLCGAGIISGLNLLLMRLGAIGGIEIDVVVTNLVHVLSFFAIVLAIGGQTTITRKS